MNRSVVALSFVLAFSLSCSDSPTATEDPETPPVPAATATAAPSPTATPLPFNTCPNGQPLVDFVEIRVFSVLNKHGEMRHYDQGGVIYVGETVRFDSQAKDRFRNRTNGCGPDGTRWDWAPDEVMMLNSDKGWNPKAIAISPGTFRVVGNIDHVHSEPLLLKIEEPPAQAGE